MEVRRRGALAALTLGVLSAACATRPPNPLPGEVRDQLTISSISVDMRSTGGPLRGLNSEDAGSLAAKLQEAVSRQFGHRLEPGRPDAAELVVVVTSYGVAHGSLALVGGQVAHHIDGRGEFRREGRTVATYAVNVYRETGNVGVVIGAARGSDPGMELAQAFAAKLWREFSLD